MRLAQHGRSHVVRETKRMYKGEMANQNTNGKMTRMIMDLEINYAWLAIVVLHYYLVAKRTVSQRNRLSLQCV